MTKHIQINKRSISYCSIYNSKDIELMVEFAFATIKKRSGVDLRN